jgi:hypothetical protein
MTRIAEAGCGLYGFIPDAGFVGTVFVNAIANLLITAAVDIEVEIKPLEDAVLNVQSKQTAHHVVRFGTLQHGQSKDIVFKVKNIKEGKAFCQVNMTCITENGPTKVTAMGMAGEVSTEIEVQVIRSMFVETLKDAISKVNAQKAAEIVDKFNQMVGKSAVATDKRVAALMQDAVGQVKIACSKDDWWRKWGRHYLPSLSCAHENQICNNFKDPGVQVYHGKLFGEIRDTLDDIFCKLPAPVPSRPKSATQLPVNMSSYNNVSYGCFAGSCLVKLSDKRQVRADEIRRGDIVMTGDCSNAEVECVVKTTCMKGRATLVEFDGGLQITPWHPVDISGRGEWVFPNEVGNTSVVVCDAVFTFVLKGGAGSVVVNGIACATLGHGVIGDKREHSYWGTQRVIDDLKKHSGWTSGFVELTEMKIIRDSITSLVCGIDIPVVSCEC